MGDMGDMYRALREHKKQKKYRDGIDCPRCMAIHPKRIPSRLLPGIKCRVCGYKRPKTEGMPMG